MNAGLKPEVPWFFEVVGNSQGNEPSAITAERMLPEHLRKVEADSLWEQSISIKREELRRLLEHIQRDVSDECRKQQTDLRATRENIIAFLRARLVDKEGDLNIPFTANLLRAIGDSFQRTVPIWAKPTLFMQGTVSAMTQEIKTRFDSVTRAWRTMRNPGPEVSERVKEAGAKILGQRGENFFDASDFAHLGKLHGIGIDASDEELTRAWTAILSVLQMGADTLPEAELDRVTLEIWKSIPIWKKVIFIASDPVLAVGGILALCLALVDFGTSAVIFTASVKGVALLGGASAFGGTAALALAGLDGLLKSHVAVPSYGRVISAACDVFGVPRTLFEESNVKEMAADAWNKAAAASPYTAETARSFDIAFLNHFTDAIRVKLPPGMKIDQKHLTGFEKLWDICVYEQKVVDEKWGRDVEAVSNVWAALELENQQGPAATFGDIWKVVFAGVPYRIYLGGYSVGDNDILNNEDGREMRLRSIETQFGRRAEGLVVGFYPRPRSSADGGRGHEIHIYTIPHRSPSPHSTQ